jgi:hypothetical protein
MTAAPDDRLRVFVSAAPGELDAEREAAVTAIKRLRLTPVVFDGGAHPFPSPDRYRASVAHCNVFVGIYGNADPPVLSVQEELRLAAGIPRLVYVKLSRENTAPQAAALVAEAAGGSLSYKPFALAEQLADFIASDLALLLTEGFDAGIEPESVRDDQEPEDHSNLPVMSDSFTGRERELEALGRLLGMSTARLTTLTGPGGIGKTRLAIEAATAASQQFEIVRLVHCEAATEPAGAVDLIGRSVGLAGSETGIASLVARLAATSTLLILDNLEQLLPDFAVTVAQLLEDCPSLHVLATSRAPLRIRAEHEFPVEPLDVPAPGAVADEMRASGAVRLYLDRAAARGVDASGDIATVARLCARLDGVPLAIELAAARAQVLPTAAILQRLDRALDLLSSSSPDVPARQRTIRAAIDWSFALLTDEERDVSSSRSWHP